MNQVERNVCLVRSICFGQIENQSLNDGEITNFSRTLEPLMLLISKISLSDAPIPLFSNRSDTNTFKVENGRYQSDTDTLEYKCYSQKTGSNLI